ncbi:hypothetical protein HUU39_27510 [candidate division KSB1 bacterium]|nr:hypothetical protein [candidate division KSB1 bacterium]
MQQILAWHILKLVTPYLRPERLADRTTVQKGIVVNAKTEHALLDLSRDDIVPYFMWDYRYTVGQIKEMLATGEESKKIWLMAKILRDARYADVWKLPRTPAAAPGPRAKVLGVHVHAMAGTWHRQTG